MKKTILWNLCTIFFLQVFELEKIYTQMGSGFIAPSFLKDFSSFYCSLDALKRFGIGFVINSLRLCAMINPVVGTKFNLPIATTNSEAVVRKIHFGGTL